MFRKVLYSMSDMLAWIGRWGLIALVLVVVVGIVLRLLHVPTKGLYETVRLLGLVVWVFALAHTQIGKGHVRVLMLLSRFSPGVQAGIDALTRFLSVAICSIAFWYVLALAYKFWHAGRLMTLYYPVPMWSLAAAIAFCLLMLDLMLVVNLYDGLAAIFRRR